MFDEINILNGKAVSTILWDMEKFYDNIDMLQLTQKAIEVDYPLMIFTLGLQMHLAPRALKAYECNAYANLPTNGIIAGCVQSNYLARVMLYSIMQRLYELSTGPTNTYIRTFVDDIRITQRGAHHGITRKYHQWIPGLIRGLRDFGCKIYL